nr:hypothetical protein [Nonomuraea diastatica]
MAQQNGPGVEGLRIDELKVEPLLGVGKQLLAAAEQDRAHDNLVFVDQAMLDNFRRK